MPNWRVDVKVSFEMNSDEIEAFEFFRLNRGGNKSDLTVERSFLDSKAGPDFLDQLLQFDLTRRGIDPEWEVDGATVKNGSDGEMVLPNEFRSVGVAFVAADVGRIIQIQGGNPKEARGHYLITAINSSDSVTVDGVLPIATSNSSFDVQEPAEVLVTLLSVL